MPVVGLGLENFMDLGLGIVEKGVMGCVGN